MRFVCPHKIASLLIEGQDPLKLIQKIQGALSSDLRKGMWRERNQSNVSGHCYVATEALFHALGGYDSSWRPYYMRANGDSHWFLKNLENGRILDPTAEQFMWGLDYAKAKGKGFLTKYPSKRAKEVLRRIGYLDSDKGTEEL
jgi:hypothetical protein